MKSPASHAEICLTVSSRRNSKAPIAIRHESHFGERVVRCFAQRPPDLWRLFERTAAGSPSAEALTADGRSWSYAQLAQEAAGVAAGLAEAGVRAGDRVAMLVGNRAEFVHALLGILRHASFLKVLGSYPAARNTG